MTQSASRIVEGFSLSHAAIINPATGLDQTWGDIYGIRSGSIAVSSQNYDNTGDDFVLSSWFWFDYGELTIEAGYIPFDLIANLTGETVVSSGAVGQEVYSLNVWTQNTLNQPTRPMRLKVPSKDNNGLVRELDIYLYKVQFMPFTFNGPTYKAGLLIDYGGRALVSSQDERGNALTEKTIGRIVSAPVGFTTG